MSAGVSAAVLWGRISLHNKLLNQKQWEECVELYRKMGGKATIDRILIQKGYLTEKHADLIRRKVQEILDKQALEGLAPAAHEPVAQAAQIAKAAAPVAARPAVAAPGGGSGGATSGGGEDDDSGEIELAEPGPGSERVSSWRPSDAEWVENTEPGEDSAATSKSAKPIEPGLEPISLDGDDGSAAAAADATKVASKIIKHEFTSLKAVTESRPKLGVTAPEPPAPPAAPRAEGEPAADDPEVREECDVAPNDIDPEAMEILKKGVSLGASDIHLASGSPPFYRLHGQLVFTELPKLTPERAKRMVLGFMDDKQQQRYLKHHDLDFAWEHPELCRFRVNALEQFRGPDIIFRVIASRIPSLEELGLPPALAKLTEWHQGLVLITGPAGSGKSTTAAALIDLVNKGRHDHVITVEDPVEFIQISKGCNVTQRQVPRDTLSFSTALKAALREDPDVIMIGEMRDLETVALAIRAAETGHLVIGTLQTKSAARTIDRVIDVFPADQQAQIRTMLSESLRGIVSQQLIPRADGKGRVVAVEVLNVVSSISNLIRDSKTFQLPSVMQTGKKLGQKLLDDSLQDLLAAGLITREEAFKAADNPKHFKEGAASAEADKAKK